MKKMDIIRLFLLFAICTLLQNCSRSGEEIRLADQPAELIIRPVSDYTLRVTLQPLGVEESIPVDEGRVLNPTEWRDPILQLTDLKGDEVITYQNLEITVRSSPLSVDVKTKEGEFIQHLVFDAKTGTVDFDMGDGPVFGLGNGGQFFDRRGTYHSMQRGHRSGEYLVFGARTPIPFLIGTEGWSMFFHRPYNGAFDLRETTGKFIPKKNSDSPKEAPLPLDLFVTFVDKPETALAEYSSIIGKPAMPPKWALGYMQSHRNLSEAGREGIMEVARTFREKELPIDALIYLGTGFTAEGWNTGHGEFEFHSNTFDRPQEMIDEMHSMNYKVNLHLTQPPESLYGNIPLQDGDIADSQHVASYWNEHKEVFEMGIDGWWPDMGDPLDNDSRLARHYVYHAGPLQERPNERPWSLHRTGFTGMPRFGGWNWSGDVNSSWKTLQAHVPVGINASLSTSPFWGTDTGGFYPTEDFTGELFVRWFQFSTFTPSFRSHGVVWRTRLPWGWNKGEMGPVQIKEYLNTGSLAADTTSLSYQESELHNEDVEPVIKKFLELRYQLIPYTYTYVHETHESGMPLMRAMWFHYPDDPEAVSQSHQYLWGRDLLIAPIVEKGTYGPHDFSLREVYLPKGDWYDFWRPYKKIPGNQSIQQAFSFDEMPIYVKAGTILPLDPVRQYIDEPTDEPTTIRIYPGDDGLFELYEDDGKTFDFQDGEFSKTRFSWNDKARILTIEPSEGETVDRQFFVALAGEQDQGKLVDYNNSPIQIQFNQISE